METPQAIDVHAHIGVYRQDETPLENGFFSGDARLVLRRARAAGVGITLVSSLDAMLPRLKGDPIAGNRSLHEIVCRSPGLRQWAVVDPTKPDTYAQAADLLQHPRTVGIKIHPEEHGYDIREHGRAIFEFAERHHAVVETHSGEENSRPAEFVRFADSFPGVTLILSHLGCGWDGDHGHQVRAIQACRHGNIYTDTSSSQSIYCGLIEWAVREAGADRILFGTDSPIHSVAAQRARIDAAEIPAAAKRRILHDNAARVFGRRVL